MWCSEGEWIWNWCRVYGWVCVVCVEWGCVVGVVCVEWGCVCVVGVECDEVGGSNVVWWLVVVWLVVEWLVVVWLVVEWLVVVVVWLIDPIEWLVECSECNDCKLEYDLCDLILLMGSKCVLDVGVLDECVLDVGRVR